MSEETPPESKEEIYEHDITEWGKRVGLRREKRQNGKLVSEEWEDADGNMTALVLYEYNDGGKPTKETWTNFGDPSRSGCREFEYDEHGKLKDERWVPHVKNNGL